MDDADARIRQLRTQVRRACDDFTGLEPGLLLPLLTRLRAELDATVDHALDNGMAGASERGWGLRRIAAAAGVSHEHVRRRIAAVAGPGRLQQ